MSGWNRAPDSEDTNADDTRDSTANALSEERPRDGTIGGKRHRQPIHYRDFSGHRIPQPNI